MNKMVYVPKSMCAQMAQQIKFRTRFVFHITTNDLVLRNFDGVNKQTNGFQNSMSLVISIYSLSFWAQLRFQQLL